MPTREIKTTLAIDGERQFKAAMDEAYRGLKVLGSEMKLNTAIFGDNEKSIEGLTKKGEILGKEIAQQKAIVAALSKAVDESASAYGENSKRTDDYRTKLNNASATLTNMERELQETNASIENFGEETQATEGKVESFDQQVQGTSSTLSDFGSKMVAAGEMMKPISDAAVDAGKKLFDLTQNSGEFADELITTSAQTGISTQKLQEWTYAARFIDTEVETMTGSMAKMIRNMNTASQATGTATVDAQKLAAAQTAQKNATIEVDNAQIKYQDALKKYGENSKEASLASNALEKAQNNLTLTQSKLDSAMQPVAGKSNATSEAFGKLGVQVTDVNGKLRNSETVFFEAIDALGRIENPTERDAIAMQIFGKSAQELNPLIKAGSAELKNLSDEANKAGIVLDDTALGALGAFDDSMQRMNAQVEAGKNVLATAFAPAIETIVTSVTGVVQKFAEWIKTLDDWQVQTILVIGAILAGLAPLLTGFGQLAIAIAALIPIIQAVTAAVMAFLATPAGIVLGAIALAAAAVWGAFKIMGAETEQAKDKLQAFADSSPSLEEALNKVKPSLMDVNDLLSSTGKTVSQLDSAIQESENAITEILSTALEEHRALRQGELDSIQKFNEDLLALQAEKLQLYRDQQIAELLKLQLEEDSLTQESALQRIANAQAALEQTNTITEQEYTNRLAIIENKHKAMGDIGSTAYKSELVQAKAYYDSSISENQSYYAQALATATDGAAKWINSDRTKWYTLNSVQKLSAGEYGDVIEQLNADNTKMFIQMVATTRDEGGKIGEWTKNTARLMLSAFENVPGDMTKEGTDAMRGLVSGLESQIPGLQNASEMSGNEIISVLRNVLDIHSPSRVLYGIGQDASTGLENGIGSKQSSVSSTAKSVGGSLVQGIWNGISNFASWLYRQISGWVDDVLGWIKDLFGIHSPSSKTRDLIGIPMVQGIADGIKKSARLVDQAMSNLMPDRTATDVALNVTRRFNDIAGETMARPATRNSGSNETELSDSAIERIVGGFKDAISDQGDVVLVIGDREFARAVRRVQLA